MVTLSEAEYYKIVYEYEQLGSIRAVSKKLRHNIKKIRRWVSKASNGSHVLMTPFEGTGKKKV